MPTTFNSTGTLPANVFRIILDSMTLLPNNRLASGQDDYVEFAEFPKDLTISKSANYSEDAILGRSEPYKVYQHSSGTRITFVARLVAMGTQKERGIEMEILGGALGLTGRFVGASMPFIGPAGNLASIALSGGKTAKAALGMAEPSSEDVATTTFLEVTKKAAWLEALTYPQYDAQGRAYPPPMVWLVYGQNFNRHGIMRDITIQYEGPWEMSTLLCMVVSCTVRFEEVNSTPNGYTNVRNISRLSGAQISGGGFGARSAIDNVRSVAGL